MREFNIRIVVPRTHPSLPGHFPGRPVVPGVVLLDAALAAIQTQLRQATRLVKIASAKFHRPVSPDESLDIRARVFDDGPTRSLQARFTATSEGAPAFEGHFALEWTSSDAASH